MTRDQPDGEIDRFHLCVTCGQLKHEDLYAEEGNCTCDDCHEAGRHEINYREAQDGDGYVSEMGQQPNATATRQTND